MTFAHNTSIARSRLGDPKRFSIEPSDRLPGPLVTYTLDPDEINRIYGPPGRRDQRAINSVNLGHIPAPTKEDKPVLEEFAKPKTKLTKLSESDTVLIPKSWIDMTDFLVFDANAARGQNHSPIITVGKKGCIYLSPVIGQTIQPESRWVVLVAKNGTTLVLRQSDKGIVVRADAGKKNGAKLLTCGAIEKALIGMGLAIPVRYDARWDDAAKAWVGRRQ